jgi:hypothetical protein
MDLSDACDAVSLTVQIEDLPREVWLFLDLRVSDADHGQPIAVHRVDAPIAVKSRTSPIELTMISEDVCSLPLVWLVQCLTPVVHVQQ